MSYIPTGALNYNLSWTSPTEATTKLSAPLQTAVQTKPAIRYPAPLTVKPSVPTGVPTAGSATFQVAAPAPSPSDPAVGTCKEGGYVWDKTAAGVGYWRRAKSGECGTIPEGMEVRKHDSASGTVTVFEGRGGELVPKVVKDASGAVVETLTNGAPPPPVRRGPNWLLWGGVGLAAIVGIRFLRRR